MLLSCENSIKEVQNLTSKNEVPTQSGNDIEYIITDSTRITYRAFAPEFFEIRNPDQSYNEFQKGGKIISYKKDGTQAWQIKANFAKNYTNDNLWELRYDVEAISDDGKTINTELLYWDQAKHLIYSDQYVRITTIDNQVLEGTGFTSDEKMDKITLKKVSGEVYLDDKTQK
ncbi:LPS export ABC transporter periplasmic protein LptC [Ancylomarina longa]|uniref:LPS export ABC transporter periplasmic protein LptC n=2 Tax=Ancylomarina longa TaxID=2487017 RepID=A0A434AUP6_9BACT|nr:LPS export ABC transporter periplasmic protein LptC [Ancylomarina longa]